LKEGVCFGEKNARKELVLENCFVNPSKLKVCQHWICKEGGEGRINMEESFFKLLLK